MTKFIKITIIFLGIMFLCCNNKVKINALHESECLKYQIGTFYNKDKTYKIVRKKNKQIEYDLKTGSEYTFEVHWLYGCAYNLIYKFSKKPIATFNLKPQDKLKIQFVEVLKTENAVKAEVEFNGKIYYQTFYLEE